MLLLEPEEGILQGLPVVIQGRVGNGYGLALGGDEAERFARDIMALPAGALIFFFFPLFLAGASSVTKRLPLIPGLRTMWPAP